jgi:hypothetical protein
VTPTVSGTLHAELDARFDGVLALYSTCAAPELRALLACSDGPRARDVESVAARVTGGTQYFLVVDGYSVDSAGRFALNVSITP